VNETTKEFCLEDFICQGINIGSIISDYSYDFPTSLGLGLEKMSTACDGKWSYGEAMHGTMEAAIVNTTALIEVLVGKNESSMLPISAEFSGCEIPEIDVELSFDDSMTADILNRITPIVERIIDRAVYVLLCVNISNSFQTNATARLLTEIDPKLVDVMDSAPSGAPVIAQSDQSSYIDWGDSILALISGLRDDSTTPIFNTSASVAECIANATMIDEIRNYTLNMLMDALTNGTGAITVPTFASVGNLTLTSVTIAGVNSFSEFALMEPSLSNNQTLQTRIGMDQLDLLVGGSLTVDSYEENITVSLLLSNLSVAMDLFLAVNKTSLDQLHISQLLSEGCLLSAVGAMNVTSLVVDTTVASIALTEVSGAAGALEADIVLLIDNAMLLLTTGFGDLLTSVIAGAAQGPLREAVNDMFASWLKEAPAVCPPFIPADPSEPLLVVWSESTLVSAMDHVVNGLLGVDGINQLMSCVTGGSGTLVLSGLSSTVTYLEIGGLDSFYNFTLMQPSSNVSEPFLLNSAIGVGSCRQTPTPPDGCNPLTVTMEGDIVMPPVVSSGAWDQLQLPLEERETEAETELVNLLEVSMSNLHMGLGLLAELSRAAVGDLRVGQLGTNGCLMSTLSALIVETLSATVDNVTMFVRDGSKSRDITNATSILLGRIAGTQTMARLNSRLGDKLTDSGAVCANGGVMPSGNDGSAAEGDVEMWMWELPLSLVCGFLATWTWMYWLGKNHRRPCGNDHCCKGTPSGYHPIERSGRQDQGVIVVEVVEGGGTEELVSRWDIFYDQHDFDESLVFHPRLPLVLRFGIVALILACFVLFTDSNLSTELAVVIVEIYAGDKVYTSPPVFAFGLGETVQDMWDAEVYALAVIICFSSGCWPYVKLAGMLYLWVVPPDILPLRTRETGFIWLDILGKWSLVDIFVMIMMTVAFCFVLPLANGFTAVGRMVPRWPFFEFFMSTVFSLLIGHVTLWAHRRVVNPEVHPSEAPTCEAIMAHRFDGRRSYRYFREKWKDGARSCSMSCSGGHGGHGGHGACSRHRDYGNINTDVYEGGSGQGSGKGSSERPDSPLKGSIYDDLLVDEDEEFEGNKISLQFTSFGRVVVGLTIMGTAAMIYFGAYLNTFVFEFMGLIGYVLKEDATAAYGFVQIGIDFVGRSGHEDDIAIILSQCGFFMFGLVMPLGLMASLLVLWCVPMSLYRQQQIFHLAEVFNSWAALDIFCIGIVAALLQLQQFAAFIIGDTCDGINVILAEYFSEPLDGDPKCFDAIAELKPVSELRCHCAPGLALLTVFVAVCIVECCVLTVDSLRSIWVGVFCRSAGRFSLPLGCLLPSECHC